MKETDLLQEDLKKGHLIVLFFGTWAYLAFGLIDWMSRPHDFWPLILARLAFSVYSALGLFFYRNIRAELHLPLVYLTTLMLGISGDVVITLHGDPVYMVALAVLVIMVLGLISLRTPHAIGVAATMFVSTYLGPAIFILPTHPAKWVSVLGIMLAATTAVIGATLSAFMYRLKKRSLATVEELSRSEKERLLLQERQERFLALEKVARELSGVTQTLAEHASRLNEESAYLSSSSEEMSMGINEVLRAVGEVTESLGSIDNSLRDTSARIDDFGRWEREEALPLRARLREISSQAADLAEKIGKISEAVADISKKTHIIALNAGIESARSGGMGGFDVISARMKGLSQEVRDKSREITVLVKKVIDTTGFLHAITDDYAARSDKVTREFLQTQEDLGSIAGEVSRIRTQSESMAKTAEQQASAVNTLSRSALSLQESVEDLFRVISDVKRLVETLSPE